jgi:glycosyltransferase involved in cell wall biosynthesis
MRIALCVWQLDEPGGSQESALVLKRHLERDHKVRLFGITAQERSGDEDTVLKPTVAPIGHSSPLLGWGVEYTLRQLDGHRRFRRSIARFDPDLVVSQRGLNYAASRYSRRTGRPHVCFVHGPELVRIARLSLGNPPWPVSVYNKLFNYLGHVLTTRVLDNASLCVVNSRFLQDRLGEHYDVDPAVVYPFVDAEPYRVSSSGDAILHVNPRPGKGIETTLGVAERLPERRFLVVGPEPSAEIHSRIQELPNVTYEGYVEDMRRVYAETRIALVPSRWEAFGRIPVESGLNGIPAICADVGGLPEAVGVPELVVGSEDQEAYAAKVRAVESEYDRYSSMVRERASERLAGPQLETFERHVASKVGVSL